METILNGVAKYASRFDAAAGWAAEETMVQKGFEPPRRSVLGVGLDSPTADEKPEMITRVLVSRYGFTSDPAIHEVRAVTSVDGKPGKTEEQLFEAAMQGQLSAHKKLTQQFDRASIDVAANDFGPLILLFTRGQQSNFDFTFSGMALIGAERVLLIRYRQNAGDAALHLKDGSKGANAQLTGQIEARMSDYAPLRITLRSARKNVRDEAEVDYLPREDRLLLPASIVYRRYVNNNLFAEDRSRFSGWHRVDGAGRRPEQQQLSAQ